MPDMTHLPRLPIEATPAYIALDTAFQELLTVVRREHLFTIEQRDANIHDLACRVHQLNVAMANAGVPTAAFDWEARCGTEHLAKQLLSMGGSVHMEYLPHNIAGLIKYGGIIDLSCDPLTWHRVGNTIGQFADAVLTALRPAGLQPITPREGWFSWGTPPRVIRNLRLDQWRLLNCLVKGHTLREWVPREEVIAAVYLPGRKQPDNLVEGIRHMRRRIDTRLRKARIDLWIHAEEAHMQLEPIPKSPAPVRN